jgi:hypothetical protein
MPASPGSPEYLENIVAEVVANARARQDHYLPRAQSLTSSQQAAVHSFFPAELLNSIRVLELKDERVPNPPYQARAKERGHALMLDFTHKAEIAHPGLIIFQQEPIPRLLFHGLVHVVQYRMLGLERYLELYVRAFLRSGVYVNVPLEVHAFQLGERFAQDPSTPFSVQSEVEDWIRTGRY